MPWYLHWKLTDDKYMDLFLDSQFYHIDLCLSQTMRLAFLDVCSCSWIVPSYWQNSWEWVFSPHSNRNQISPLWQQGYRSLGLSYFGRTTPLWNRIGGMEAGLDQDSINSQLFLLRFSSFSWINVSQFIICLFSVSGILK